MFLFMIPLTMYGEDCKMDIISYALAKNGTSKAVTDYLDEHLTNPTNPPIDTSLSISGAAADAKKTGDELSDLKEGLNSIEGTLSDNKEELSDLYGTKTTYINAFNSTELLTDGITRDGTEFVGTVASFGTVGTDGSIAVNCKASTVYTLALDYYTEQNAGTTGRGLSLQIIYSDSSLDDISILNTASAFTHLTFTTDSNKTVTALKFVARTALTNVFHIKDIMLAEGDEETLYVPYYIANDVNARARLTSIEEEIGKVAVNYYNKNKIYENQFIGNTGKVSNSTGSLVMGRVPFEPKEGNYICLADGVPLGNKTQICLFSGDAWGTSTFIIKYTPAKNFSVFHISSDVASQCHYLGVNIYAGGLDEGETALELNEKIMLICLDDIKPSIPYTAYGVTTSKFARSKYLRDKSKSDVRWIFDSKFQNVAYSGSRNGYPANTLGSYEGYALAGFDGIKGDVRVTGDGHLVMCHDEGFTLDSNGRITTYDPSNQTYIIDMTYAEVMALEYAIKPEGVENYVHPATLEDLAKVCKKYGKIPYITIRRDNIHNVVAPAVYNLLKKYGLIGNAIINCVDYDPLVSMRELDDDITLSYVMPYDVDPTLTKYVYAAQSLGNCQCAFYIANGYSMTAEALQTKITARQGLMDLCDTLGIRKWIGQIGNADCISLSFDSTFSGAQTTVKLVE